jgi:nucleoside-diphosphate-sugar epimerase
MTLALVTGSLGWLGTRLVSALLDGLPEVDALARPGKRAVRCLVLPEADMAPLGALAERVEISRGDLTDRASLDAFVKDAKGATLFHCAGVIHPSRGTSEFRAVNVEGTRNLIDAAKHAQVRRVVHVSSNSPIGTNRAPDEVFDESAPFHPYMGYGKSKMLAEQIVNAASGDIETVIIRPPWFYGPGQPPRQTVFFTMIKEGRGPIVGSGDNRRSMAYVDNICQGLLLCERTEAARGQTYWIADAHPYTMNEILGTVERLLETDFGMQVAHKRMHLPGIASQIAYGVDGLMQSVGLYHQKIHVLSEMNKTIACTIDKARRELGYDPKIALEEGMRRSIRWLLDHGGTI